MRYVKTELYIEFNELVAAGISEDTIKSAKQRQSNGWEFVDDPDDNRRSLIKYETLKEQYKQLIIDELCGGKTPYEYFPMVKIEDMINPTQEDIEYLQNYVLGDETRLSSTDKFRKILRAAGVMNLLATTGPVDMRTMRMSSTQFYDAVITIVRAEKLPVPATYNRLRIKVRDYKKSGPAVLVTKLLGNTNSKKLGEEQIDFITELYGKANNFSGEQVAVMYNNKAREKNWPLVTTMCVQQHIKKIQIAGSRSGINEWRNANDFVVKRMRPSKPNLLWVGDATPYELFYKVSERNNGIVRTKYHKRVVMYAVIDAFNDKIVGWAVGETETADLARKAWKNACLNTGCLPYQIKTDNFSRKQLEPFYQRLAYNNDFYTPSAVGNARDKVIEQMFGKLYNFITRYHHNASGRNITAKEQPNRDYLNKIKHTFPQFDEVIEQIATDVFIWNNAVRQSKGASLNAQWKESLSGTRALSDVNRFMLFGTEHRYTNKLTNMGIMFTIAGVQRRYMKFDDEGFEFFTGDIDKTFQVTYDPDDYSKIMVTNKNGRRWVLPLVNDVPMAYMDFKEGDRANLNKQLEFKKRVKKYVVTCSDERKKRLLENGLNEALEPEALIKSMFTIDGKQKPQLYEAQEEIKRFEVDQERYTGDNNNVEDKYFDDGY